MTDVAPRSDASLPEFLAHRARRASDGRLALDVAIGLLAGAAVLAWRPPGWVPFLSAALCLAAFGTWGITDRELQDLLDRSSTPGRVPRTLRLARAGAACVGAAAAIALLFSACALALGTWIS